MLLASVPVAAFFIFCVEKLSHHEPVYQGCPLSKWVALYGGQATVSEKGAAAAAIHAIGTNALPWLLMWTDCEQGTLDYLLRQLEWKLPLALHGTTPALRLAARNNRAADASKSFGLLGPLAATAIPELEHRLTLTNSHRKTSLAFFSLCTLGPASLPAITNALARPEIGGSRFLGSLKYLGTNMSFVVPTLVNNLEHTNLNVAATAAELLPHFFRCNPELIQQRLISGLRDLRPEIRRVAATSIWNSVRWEHTTDQALPDITKALNDPDADVRKQVGYALAELKARAKE